MSETLPRLTEWEKNPDAATPNCPKCGHSLGVLRAVFVSVGRHRWVCDSCNRFYDAGAIE